MTIRTIPRPPLSYEDLERSLAAVEEFAKSGKEFPFEYADKHEFTNATRLNSMVEITSRSFMHFTSDQGKANPPIYLLNIAFTPNAAGVIKKWQKLKTIISDESFGENAQDSQMIVAQRIAVFVGMNKPMSLERDEDVKFLDEVRSLRRSINRAGFHCRILATLWKPSLCNKQKIEAAQIGYIVLEYIGKNDPKDEKTLAEKVKERLQTDEQREKRKAMIPFQHIRQWPVDDIAKQKRLPELLSTRSVFVFVMDDDPDGFRYPGDLGLFSIYDRLIQERTIVKQGQTLLPQVISTTYAAAPHHHPKIQLYVIVDELMRQELGYLSYLAEPNYGVNWNDPSIRNGSFIKLGQKRELNLESRRHLNSFRSALDPDRVVVVARRSLMTSMDRLGKGTKCEDDPDPNLSFKLRQDFVNSRLGLEETLTGARNFPQSHAKAKFLAEHVYNALKDQLPPLRDPQAASGSNCAAIFKSRFTNLFNCFDFITFSKETVKGIRTYSYRHFEIALQVYEEWTKHLYQALKDLQTDKEYVEAITKLFQARLPHVIQMAEELLQDTKSKHEQALCTAMSEVVGIGKLSELTAAQANKACKAAVETFNAIIHTAEKLNKWAVKSTKELEVCAKNAAKRKNIQVKESTKKCAALANEIAKISNGILGLLKEASQSKSVLDCEKKVSEAIAASKTIHDKMKQAKEIDVKGCVVKVKKWVANKKIESLKVWEETGPSFNNLARIAHQALSVKEKDFATYKMAVQKLTDCIQISDRSKENEWMSKVRELARLASNAQPSFEAKNDQLLAQKTARIAAVGTSHGAAWANSVLNLTGDREIDYSSVFQAQFETLCDTMEWMIGQQVSPKISQEVLEAAIRGGQAIYFAFKAQKEMVERGITGTRYLMYHTDIPTPRDIAVPLIHV